MKYLIDGYNLLFFKNPARLPFPQKRSELIAFLNRIASELCIDLVIVFDGSPDFQRGHYDSVEIVYTAKEESADDYIEEVVHLATTPQQHTVVSNDNQLRKRSSLLGAKAITVDAFFSLLSNKRRRKKGIPSEKKARESDREIARLLALFEKHLSEDTEL